MGTAIQTLPFDPSMLPMFNVIAQAMRNANEPLIEALNKRFDDAESNVDRRHAENVTKRHELRNEMDTRFGQIEQQHRTDVDALWAEVRRRGSLVDEMLMHQKRLLGPDGMGTSGLMHEVKTELVEVKSTLNQVLQAQTQSAARGEGRADVFKTALGIVTGVTGVGGVVTLVYAAIHFIGKH